MAGRIDKSDFMSFSTVFKSNLNAGRVIMKVSVKWNPVCSCEDFAPSGARTRDR